MGTRDTAKQLKRELAAAQAALADEREWWESMREDHAQHLMILKDASLKRLSRSPVDALQAVKAAAWGEGARWAAVECGVVDSESNGWLAPGDNPYREGADHAE